jgi:selenocysteine lyase/cysteine desulfurase
VYSDGEALNYEAVEASARHRGIAIRGGCFCNPGASERAFGVNAAHARDCVHGKFSVAQFRACMDGKAVGALRASLGVATSEADIDRLLELVAELTGREVRPVTSFSGRRPL